MKKWITAAVVVVSIMCFTGIAFAGVNPINQTGISPVQISQPGSYQLQSNLVVLTANTTAIKVNVDNVTIDLNGFAILGPTVCTGSGRTLLCSPTGTGNGIDAGGHQNIKVYNGTVSGMGNMGILTGDGAVIESVRVASNGYHGISVVSGTVSGNTASRNYAVGIILNGSGTVSGNTAIGNSLMGIILNGSGTVSGNTAIGNGGDGISVVSGTVSGNTANDNSGDGIYVYSGTVSGNTANGNGLVGIFVNGSGTVSGNAAIGNVGYGLNLGSSAIGLSTGYVNNVLGSSVGKYVTGGVNLKPNLCGPAPCP